MSVATIYEVVELPIMMYVSILPRQGLSLDPTPLKFLLDVILNATKITRF